MRRVSCLCSESTTSVYSQFTYDCVNEEYWDEQGATSPVFKQEIIAGLSSSGSRVRTGQPDPLLAPSSPLVLLATYIEIPYEFTDATPMNWPTRNTELDESVRNKRGMFRIDDQLANPKLSVAEQRRRESTIDFAMKSLGTGLYDLIQEDSQRRAHVARWEVQMARGEPESPMSEGFGTPGTPATPTSPLTPGTPGIAGNSWLRAVPMTEIHPKKKKRLSHRGASRQKGSEKNTHILRYLPDGYALFQAKRPSDGIQTADSYDQYIYGSRIVPVFNSYDSFIPHLWWIYEGMRGDVPCCCKHCLEKRAKELESPERGQEALPYSDDDPFTFTHRRSGSGGSRSRNSTGSGSRSASGSLKRNYLSLDDDDEYETPGAGPSRRPSRSVIVFLGTSL